MIKMKIQKTFLNREDHSGSRWIVKRSDWWTSDWRMPLGLVWGIFHLQAARSIRHPVDEQSFADITINATRTTTTFWWANYWGKNGARVCAYKWGKSTRRLPMTMKAACPVANLWMHERIIKINRNFNDRPKRESILGGTKRMIIQKSLLAHPAPENVD